MTSAFAKTLTRTFTMTRIAVVEDQFDLMLRYSSMGTTRRQKILKRISEKKVEGLGLYLEDDGYMLAEVSLIVDWEKHSDFVNATGSLFDADRPGWEDGVCPEISVAANRIAKEAKNQGKQIRVWIRFSGTIRQNPNEHKAICDELGFNYRESAPGWKSDYVMTGGKCPDLPELSTFLKSAK